MKKDNKHNRRAKRRLKQGKRIMSLLLAGVLLCSEGAAGLFVKASGKSWAELSAACAPSSADQAQDGETETDPAVLYAESAADPVVAKILAQVEAAEKKAAGRSETDTPPAQEAETEVQAAQGTEAHDADGLQDAEDTASGEDTENAGGSQDTASGGDTETDGGSQDAEDTASEVRTESAGGSKAAGSGLTGAISGVKAMSRAEAASVNATTEGSTAGAAAGATTEAATTEELDNSSELLKDDHGRITLWEWNLVTKNNFGTTMGDGKFHPSMLFFYDSDTNRDRNKWKDLDPVGFISTYADKAHIWRGITDSNYWHVFDVVTTDRNTWNAWWGQQIGWNCAGGKPVCDSLNEDESKWIKLDDQYDDLNGTGVYLKKKFYTSKGGSLGVPYIKSYKTGTDIIADMGLDNVSQWCAETDIYIQRSSAKKNSNDTSWLDMGKSDDWYLETWRRSGDNYQPRFQIWQGVEGTSGREKRFTFHPAAGDDNSEFWVAKGALIGMDDDDLDWCKIHNNDSEHDKAPNLGVTKTGWIVSYDPKVLRGYGGGEWGADSYYAGNPHYHGWNLLWPETTGIHALFRWYVGTPHVFATIKGQAGTNGKETGGDTTSGEGRVTTIKKGQVYAIKECTYEDAQGKLNTSEGVILPETSKIVIEKGGILSVEANFINNGRIVNNGGTIILKASPDGKTPNGCISPFLETNEGTIECSNGGTIIVMPGCKLFTLSDLCMNNNNDKIDKKGVDYALSLNDGSTIINYGLMVNSYAYMDCSCRIENRKNGVILAAHCRKETDQLLYNAKVTGTGASTSVATIEKMENATYYYYHYLEKRVELYGGIYGKINLSVNLNNTSSNSVIDNKTTKIGSLSENTGSPSAFERLTGFSTANAVTVTNFPVILNDKTATIVNKWEAYYNTAKEEYNFLKYIRLVTPEY